MITKTFNLAIKAADDYWGWNPITFILFDTALGIMEWSERQGSRFKSMTARWISEPIGYNHDVIAFVRPDLSADLNEESYRTRSIGHECVHFRSGPHVPIDIGEKPITEIPSRLSLEAMPQDRIYIQTGIITSYGSMNVLDLGKQVWQAIKEKEDAT